MVIEWLTASEPPDPDLTPTVASMPLSEFLLDLASLA